MNFFFQITRAHYKTVPGCMCKKCDLYFTGDVWFTYSFTWQLFFNKCIKKCNDIVIYAEESTSAARKDFFKKAFDEMDKKFKIEYVMLIKVFSTKSEIVIQAIEKTLTERDIDISKTRSCSLDATNSMSGKYKCLEIM